MKKHKHKWQFKESENACDCKEGECPLENLSNKPESTIKARAHLEDRYELLIFVCECGLTKKVKAK